jgi:cytoskeletal protein CcmA (bactofilin family)
MREERGKITGDLVIDELYTLWGMIVGNVRVVKGGKFYMRGSVYGNVTVEADGRAHLFGHVQGNLVVTRYAKVIHSGVLSGNVDNRGGRVFIELTGRVEGKIKNKKGAETIEETKLQKHQRQVLED